MFHVFIYLSLIRYIEITVAILNGSIYISDRISIDNKTLNSVRVVLMTRVYSNKKC
jgi:hypothetical protein